MIKVGDYVEIWRGTNDSDIRYFICKGEVTAIQESDGVIHHYWVKSHDFNDMIKNVSPRKYRPDEVVLDKSRIRIEKINKITGE